MTVRHPVLDEPGMAEHLDALVASAPPLKPEQVELINRVFRPAPTDAKAAS